MKLFDYQEVGADFLAGRRRALLFDAPGLGKTAQAIRGADRAGVAIMETVCPASVVTQWRRAHAAVAETDCEFNSKSYEAARDKGLTYGARAVVLDEIHYLKNVNSGRTKAVLGQAFYGTDGAIKTAAYVWGLSGTPCPNNPSDLYPSMHALVPGSLRSMSGHIMSHDSFVNKFCDFYMGDYGPVFKGGRNLDELADRLAPYMLRRTKTDIGKKEPVFGELWLDAGEAGAALRAAELQPEARLVAEAFAAGGFEALKLLARTEHTGVARYRRYIGVLKILPVVKWLADQLDSGNSKICVMAYHKEVMAGIQEKLLERGYESVIYQGGMNAKDKEGATRRFITDPQCRVFCGQLDASGTGLDGLQHASSDMLIVEPSWISDTNYQAICRLDREGQTGMVIGRLVGLEGSLDGAIMAAARRRAADNKALFN